MPVIKSVEWEMQSEKLQEFDKVAKESKERRQYSGKAGSYFPVWVLTMGNAATCKICGSDTASKTVGIDYALNQHTDYYKAADTGANVDDLLVRDGKADLRWYNFFFC